MVLSFTRCRTFRNHIYNSRNTNKFKEKENRIISTTFINTFFFFMAMRWSVLIVLIMLLCAPALALDELTGFVNDEANVISPAYEQNLNQILYDLKLNTSVEMAVATVSTTGDVPLEEYSIELAHNVLGEKGKDNGLLILLTVDDRAYRIEVGYGLEPILPDALAGRIGNEVMTPRFKEGNYEQGLLDGVMVISSILKGDESWETQGAGKPAADSGAKIRLGFWGFFILILIIGNIIAGYKHAKKKTKGKLKKGGRPDTGDFLAAWFIASMFGRGGRGGGGFGGGMGGFGGFGGGGFGGGGFSGRF